MGGSRKVILFLDYNEKFYEFNTIPLSGHSDDVKLIHCYQLLIQKRNHITLDYMERERRKMHLLLKLLNDESLDEFIHLASSYHSDFYILWKLSFFSSSRRKWTLLCYASSSMQDNDLLVALEATKSPKALLYASDRLQSNFNLVLHAVSHFGTALQYASTSLRENQEICLRAIENNLNAIEFVWDREVVLQAISEGKCSLKDVCSSYQNDHEVVLAAVRHDGEALLYASKFERNNIETVITAMKNTKRALNYASKGLKRILRRRRRRNRKRTQQQNRFIK